MAHPNHQRTALRLAAGGVPVLPLRAAKVPFANCRACAHNACGGRPNMKTPGPCACPAPCHGWAAATTETMGHSTITMTLDTYAHVMDSTLRSAAARMDDTLNLDAEEQREPPGGSTSL